MMAPTAAARQYQAEREALLQDLRRRLESDRRVVAAWLFGSLGRGEADALSDIDLWVVVDDDALASVLAERHHFVAQIGQTVLNLEAPQNAPVGGAYLMTAYEAPTGPHIVDWYWQACSLALIPPQTRVLFDRRGLAPGTQLVRFVGGDPDPVLEAQPKHYISFFWMMWLITAKHVARAPETATVPLLPYLLNPFTKTQQFLGRPQTWASAMAETASLPSPSDKLQLLDRLVDDMAEMMARLAASGHAVPEAVVPGARRYLALVEEWLNVKH